jgi:hypothetical protein
MGAIRRSNDGTISSPTMLNTHLQLGHEPPLRERHYSVSEIGEIWNLSRDAVRKIFKDEPGVMKIGDDGSRSKRGYHTLRIPESVMERVYRRLCIPDLTPARARAYSSTSRDHQLLSTTDGP